MSPIGRTADQRIGRIATGQHGLVTRVQALRDGVSDYQLKARLKRGALIVTYPGVYRVGHRAPSVEARYLAAVLTCGEGALLCGRAAAYLWGLLKGRPPAPEVVAPSEKRIPGLKTRRQRRLSSRDGTKWRGIPLTTLPRTIVDLAAELDEDELARAWYEAGIKHNTTPAQVEAVLAQRPGSPGVGRLRRVLQGEVKVALSALERRFLQRLREAGLPPPETNRPAGGRRVDCRWPTERLTVELDGYRYHRSRHAWELDRRREREARARGDEFRRYSWNDVTEDPNYMLDELRRLLAVTPPGLARSPAPDGSSAALR